MLSALNQTAMRSADISSQASCPFCTAKMSLQALQRHIGRHQEQLALFALPSNLDSTENGEKDDEHEAVDVDEWQDEDSDISDTEEDHMTSGNEEPWAEINASSEEHATEANQFDTPATTTHKSSTGKEILKDGQLPIGSEDVIAPTDDTETEGQESLFDRIIRHVEFDTQHFSSQSHIYQQASDYLEAPKGG
ncbi:hypothetical protein P280DRAFT_543899 [Massarina eburnea CBS 473.64]|uniref:C2H2-type domain-containing protein n=1 Tax=Massarina eburnea CBS 473.64 TaxID=1395130 RepID=A0A6A6S0S2_9PLEO|nr:hypothetical protein P280DRAFT_543899 [Massarina eburnea CBS 473.64]